MNDPKPIEDDLFGVESFRRVNFLRFQEKLAPEMKLAQSFIGFFCLSVCFPRMHLSLRPPSYTPRTYVCKTLPLTRVEFAKESKKH